MKSIILTFFLLNCFVLIYPDTTKSQTDLANDWGKSNLYIGTRGAVIEFYKRKLFEKDTLINEKQFKKYRWETLGFGRDILETEYTYELFNKNEYKLLDSELKTIHKIKFSEGKQNGVLFYKEQEIKDTSFISSNVNTRYMTVYKGYKGEDSNTGIFFNKDHTNLEYSSDLSQRQFLFHLYGEPIGLLCKHLDKEVVYPRESPSFKKIGDKIQYVLYSDKEFVEKSIKNGIPMVSDSTLLVSVTEVTYVGDTIIAGEKNNILEVRSAKMEEEKIKKELVYTVISNSRISDSYNKFEHLTYFRDSYPFFGGDLEMKSFSIYYTDTLSNKMNVILNLYPTPYFGSIVVKYYTDFPFPIISVSTQRTELTYCKIDGKEYGELK